MEIELYNYQNKAIKFVLENINKSDVLLAAAPNAGKTIMTAYVIDNLIQNNKRVLCSVHGTNVLKRQFYDSICNIVGTDKVSIYDTTDISLYSPEKPVQIMIYQNKKQMEECVENYGLFDYLIVDEAHKFYDNTDSMTIIVDNFVKGSHLLLTGSPAIFKDKVKNGEIVAEYISASLIESTEPGQYDTEILLDIVSNDVDLSVDDYNILGEVCKKSETKLTNNTLVLESVLKDNFGKTIIYVKRKEQANEIKTYLKTKQIKTYISHSDNDKDSENIKKFRNSYTGKDNVVLIVVNRATEGFDDPNVSIIDMTYTKNIDTLYQRYSRAIRKRTDAINKKYIKVVPNNGNSAEVFTHIMTAVLMLLRQEHYENFNGKNFSIPTFKPDVIRKPLSGVGSVKSYCVQNVIETDNINDNNIIIKSSEKPVSVKDLVNNENFTVKLELDNNSYIITKETFDYWSSTLTGEYKIIITKSTDTIDDDLLLETSLYSGIFFDIKDELYGTITRYATNKLSDVLRGLNGENYYDDKEGYFKLFRNENITGVSSWYRIYKNLIERDSIKYRSEPWNLFNQSSKEFFDECYPDKLDFYNNMYGYFKLFRVENITSSDSWRKIYKMLSERDELKYHSHPWDLFKLTQKEFFNNCYPDKQEYYNNIQGYFELFKKENITSSKIWLNKYKELSKRDGVTYYSTPWKIFGYSLKDFFAECFSKNKTNKEGYFELFKKENITSSKIWSNKYKELTKRDGVAYYSVPWCVFGYSLKDFFAECFPEQKLEFYNDKNGYFEIFRKENITTGHNWVKIYKKLSVRDNTKYHSAPCRLFNQSDKDFFTECFPEKKLEFYNNKDGYFKLFRNENITNSVIWRNTYKKLSLQNNIKYHSTPWILFNNSEKDFFTECFPEQKLEFYNDKNGYFEIIKNNDITGIKNWVKMFKILSERDNIRYHSNPWRLFKQTPKEFFDECLGKNKLNKEDYFQLLRKENITNSELWGKKYKELSERDNIKYHSNPWNLFGYMIKDFFAELRDYITNNQQN